MRRGAATCALVLALSAGATSGLSAGDRAQEPDWYPAPVEYTEDGREKVDLELVLAVDVSSSIDETEARRQREGHVAALADPEVISAIQSGGYGRIAVMLSLIHI